MPIEIESGPELIKISSAQRTEIRTAVQRAKKMAHRVRSDMERIWDQRRGLGLWPRRKSAWRETPRFVRWLGEDKLSRTQIRRTRKRIIEIEKRLGKRLLFKVRPAGGLCRPGRWAWHAGGLQARRIRLCPPFFQGAGRSQDDIDRQASVIVHELAHGFGQVKLPGIEVALIPGTGHPKGTTTRAEALNLADDHPKLARRSPENFEHLYRAYGGR